MSVRSVRFWLWIASLLALPVPIWLLGPGHVPVLHILELGLVAIAFGAAEGFRGVVGGSVAIFAGQALVYAAILYALVALLVRAMGRFRTHLLAFAALLVVAACFARVYHSPYHADTSQVTLLEVYP
jgi:hypothetical protein